MTFWNRCHNIRYDWWSRASTPSGRYSRYLHTAFAVSGTQAAELDVQESTSVPASPDKVWAVLRKFSGLPGWHLAVAAKERDPAAKDVDDAKAKEIVAGDVQVRI